MNLNHQGNPSPAGRLIPPANGHLLEHVSPSASPAVRKQPESRVKMMETGEIPPIGFGLRTELFCKPAIQAAIYRADGLEFTRERIKHAFLAQWGWELHEFQAQKATAGQELHHLEREHARVSEVLKATPQSPKHCANP